MSFENRKMRIGRVVSDKMNKTVVVQVERRKTHPLYKKSTRVNKQYKVHDNHNTCRIGDRVRIVETRPLSKFKRWRIDEILGREDLAEIKPEEISTDLFVDSVDTVRDTVPAESTEVVRATSEAEDAETTPEDEPEPAEGSQASDDTSIVDSKLDGEKN